MMSRPPAVEYRRQLAGFCARFDAGDAALDCYRDNYRGSHVRALRGTFPVVREALGPDNFDALASVYSEHYPAAQWDINLYGERFDDLLAAQKNSAKAAEVDWALVALIARIEFAISAVYYAVADQYPAAEPWVIEPAPTGRHPGDLAVELAGKHPYADVRPPLDVTRAISVWRQQGRIQIGNRSSC